MLMFFQRATWRGSQQLLDVHQLVCPFSLLFKIHGCLCQGKSWVSLCRDLPLQTFHHVLKGKRVMDLNPFETCFGQLWVCFD